MEKEGKIFDIKVIRERRKGIKAEYKKGIIPR
jgi:hypothetical protein